MAKTNPKDIIFDDLGDPKLTRLQKLAVGSAKKGNIEFTQEAVLNAAKGPIIRFSQLLQDWEIDPDLRRDEWKRRKGTTRVQVVATRHKNRIHPPKGKVPVGPPAKRADRLQGCLCGLDASIANSRMLHIR